MDFAGTAQRNPLLHYTKKIVLMPPSTIIVGTAHMMKMKGMFFSSPLAQMKNGRERVAFPERAPVWLIGRSSSSAGD